MVHNTNDGAKKVLIINARFGTKVSNKLDIFKCQYC